MGKYLKKFENHSAYDAFTGTSEFILPNVSICVQEGDVHYNPSSPVPPTPTYESVDLGLPSGTLWAKYNVGATSETEYGNYYQYGKGAAQYAATSGDSDYSGEEDPLAASADTAAQVWGGSWHMPTGGQFQELIDNTTSRWETIGGISGRKYTAQNGNYIFLPAAGYCDEGSVDSIGEIADYWTSSTSAIESAYYSAAYDDGDYFISDIPRYTGLPVRPVIG